MSDTQVGSGAPAPDYNQQANYAQKAPPGAGAGGEKTAQLQEKQGKAAENMAELTQKIAELQDEINSGNATTAKGQAKQQQKLANLTEQFEAAAQELKSLTDELSTQVEAEYGDAGGVKGKGQSSPALGTDSIQSHGEPSTEQATAKATSAGWATMSPTTLDTVMNGDPVLTGTKNVASLPKGPEGTGNPWFSPNPMATFFICFSKLMDMQKELSLLGSKLAILAMQTTKEIGTMQKEMTISAGQAEAKQHFFGAAVALGQAAISSAQLGASVYAMRAASTRMDKTIDDANSNFTKAEGEFNPAELKGYKDAKQAVPKQQQEIEQMQQKQIELNSKKDTPEVIQQRTENKKQLDIKTDEQKQHQATIDKFEGKDDPAQKAKFDEYHKAKIKHEEITTGAFTTYIQDRSTRVIIFNNAMDVLKNTMEGFKETASGIFTLERTVYQGQAEYYGAMTQIISRGIDMGQKTYDEANQFFFALCDFLTKLSDQELQAFSGKG